MWARRRTSPCWSCARAIRIRRQLQEQAQGPAAALPLRDGARGQARRARVTWRQTRRRQTDESTTCTLLCSALLRSPRGSARRSRPARNCASRATPRPSSHRCSLAAEVARRAARRGQERRDPGAVRCRRRGPSDQRGDAGAATVGRSSGSPDHLYRRRVLPRRRTPICGRPLARGPGSASRPRRAPRGVLPVQDARDGRSRACRRNDRAAVSALPDARRARGARNRRAHDLGARDPTRCRSRRHRLDRVPGPARLSRAIQSASTAASLADPKKRAAIVAFVRTLIEATARIKSEPRAVWPLVAATTGYDAALIEKVWRHEGYPATLAADLLD